MPPLKLTPALVRSLGTPGVRSEHRDAVVTGLALRVGASGDRVYVLNYSHKGRNHRLKLGAPSEAFTLAAARAQAKDLLEAVRKGANPAAERRTERRQAGHTVSDLVAKMMHAIPLKPSTRAGWEQMRRKDIDPSIGQRPAGEVTRGEVKLWMARIAERAPGVAARAFEVVSRAYSWALEMDLVPASPCLGIKKRQNLRDDRVLTTQEVRCVVRALVELGAGSYADLVWLLLWTGVRKGEALGARAEEFEGVQEHHRTAGAPEIGRSNARWTVPGVRTKNGDPHVVPLSPQAVVVVRRRLEMGGPFLFPALTKPSVAMYLDTKWTRRLKAAAIRWKRREVGPGKAGRMSWKIHGLRHTMATHMREDLRVDRNVVALILGHSQVGGGGSTHVYDRAELLGERRAALVAWGGWVESVAAGERATVLPMRG